MAAPHYPAPARPADTPAPNRAAPFPEGGPLSRSRLQLKLGDKVLIALVACALALGGAYAAWRALAAPSTPAAANADAKDLVVVCQSKDGFYRVDPLDTDAAYTVSTPHGYNNVTISGGTVDVTSADCDNQVCVDSAPISQPGEQIVCLPHEVVLEVAASADDVAPLSYRAGEKRPCHGPHAAT